MNEIKPCPICDCYVPAERLKNGKWMDSAGHEFEDAEAVKREAEFIAHWIGEAE